MSENALVSAAKLRAVEQACGRLFDEVPYYISIQDREFRILTANRKTWEDFGDCLGEFCYRVYKGRSAPCPECPVARTFADGCEHSSQEKIFDRRGLPRDVLVNTRPLRDPSGQVLAAMELFTDVTVQKELEHRLHDSLTRFQNLFDLAPCFISVQDRELRVIEANRRLMENFSWRLGGRCYQIYKGRSEPCPQCLVAQTFQDGKPRCGEDVLVDRSGRSVQVVVHTAAIRDPRGQITGVMELCDDVSEIRALEDKLASLGRLVGGIAHSVKNVLEGLRGGLYIGNLGFRDNKPEDIRAGWEMVERNVARLSRLIMDMLYCAREASPRRLPVSPAAVLQEVFALYAERARQTGISLEAEADSELTLLAEPRDIHSLLSNLVGNAIDACCSEEGEGKSYRVKVRVARQDEQAVIQVEDNGVGMDEETRSKLFTKFFSTKGPFGTGLGLLVAHKVVTEHGGTISAQSSPGQGSVFTVRLPLQSPVAGAAPTATRGTTQ